ncbi:MAG: hypothetical protein R2769_09370 [Saprospiraceae bacterium]
MNSKISLTEATEYLIFLLEKEYGKAEARSVSRIAIEEFSGKKTFKEDDFLPLSQLGNFESMCARLRKHEPVQYILGQADFYGLKFNVDKNVLIPRQETEELVVWIMETIQNEGPKEGKLLDIGTGSGCIPITIAQKMENGNTAVGTSVKEPGGCRKQQQTEWNKSLFRESRHFKPYRQRRTNF